MLCRPSAPPGQTRTRARAPARPRRTALPTTIKNLKRTPTRITSVGGTPLHTAADCDQPAAVAALLAPPCAADHTLLLNGTTPLYLVRAIRCLMGYDSSLGDTTPLYLAAQRGWTRAAEELLTRGADPNLVMRSGTFSTAVSA